MENELLTSRDCCKGKAVAHEAVVNYREWATTKTLFNLFAQNNARKRNEG